MGCIHRSHFQKDITQPLKTDLENKSTGNARLTLIQTSKQRTPLLHHSIVPVYRQHGPSNSLHQSEDLLQRRRVIDER